jgi:hypothetical protein
MMQAVSGKDIFVSHNGETQDHGGRRLRNSLSVDEAPCTVSYCISAETCRRVPLPRKRIDDMSTHRDCAGLGAGLAWLDNRDRVG